MNRLPSLPVIPPGVQAILLNSDNSAVPTVDRNTSVPLLSNELQALPLSGDSDAAAPQVSGLSYFQLLETVSPHVQSVMLDKCTVLELSSLAFVSSSLRKGALATMAKRTLNVRFRRFHRLNEFEKEVTSLVMFIDDIVDPSRNMSVEFCNCQSNECKPWPKIQKLLLFCGHANVKQLDFLVSDIDIPDPCKGPRNNQIPFGINRLEENMNSSNRYAMRSDHSSTMERTVDEFFVDKFTSNTNECAKLLHFVSPRFVHLDVNADYDSDYPSGDVYKDNVNFPNKWNSAVFGSRGLLSAESVRINLMRDINGFQAVDDDRMLKLNASTIILYHNPGYDLKHLSQAPRTVSWSPVGVSRFIEQWLRGSRTINKVVGYTYIPYSYEHRFAGNTSIPHYCSMKMFSRELLITLWGLDPAPKVVFTTGFDHALEERLQKMDGRFFYIYDLDFDPDDAAVIRVTRPDGQQLTIALSRSVNTKYDYSTQIGFIDIFPSN